MQGGLTMLSAYQRHTAAQAYIFGFVYNDLVFMRYTDTLPQSLIRKQRDGYYVRITRTQAKAWLPGAICLGIATQLYSTKYNKGVMFESLVHRYYGIEWHGKDNTPFYKAGDIEIDGKQVQIKFRHARLAYYSTLQRLGG